MGTATTAPVAGNARHERTKALWRFVRRHLVGPTVGGARGSKERKALWRMAIVIPVANLCGAIDLFLFLWYVFPLPDDAATAQVREANAIAFVVVMFVTFMICSFRSKQLALPIADWLDSGKAAEPEITRRVLRQPLDQTLLSAQAWVACAIAFGALNAQYSIQLGGLVAAAILLGGVTTCGTLYLLSEKALVPVAARALAGTSPRKPALPGVDARVLITFAVTTAGPLLGLAALAVAVLAGADIPQDRLPLTVLVLALMALFSGLFGLKLVARSLAASLRSMRAAVARVEQGDLDADVRIYDGSEIGVLQSGFNRMVAGLRERERLRDLFGRHVGEDVARAALERGVALGGEQRDAAVMFVDLIGSTALAAERNPDDVMRLLNRYFGLVVDVVGRHGGWVNKFEGDGALCVFGAPHDLADAPGCALAAARELDQRLRRALPELRAAIGVSSGRVVAGNVGAAQRFEYTVIGDPVNEAARLTQLAKSTEERIRASEATLAAAGEAERARWRRDGEAMLRGRPEPTQLVVPA